MTTKREHDGNVRSPERQRKRRQSVSPAPPTTTTQSRIASRFAVTGVSSSARARVPLAVLFSSTSAATQSPTDRRPRPAAATVTCRKPAGTRRRPRRDAYVHGDTYVLGDTGSAASAARVPRDLHRLPPPPLDASASSIAGDERPVVADVRNRAAPSSSAAERDGTGSAARSPGPKRRPRVRVGYARDEDAARGLGVEQPTIPAGESETNGSGARADVDDANDPASGDAARAGPRRRVGSRADPLEREMSQKRRWCGDGKLPS